MTDAKKPKCQEDMGFEQPTDVACPCECGGVMRSDGRNLPNNLTFLQCSVCKCTYVARDSEDENKNQNASVPGGSGEENKAGDAGGKAPE